MIFYDRKKIFETENWSDDSIFVLADFDKTLTSPISCSSWEIIFNNENVSENYKKEVSEYFNYYRPIEINESMDINIRKKHMIEWWKKEIDLFIKYNFNEKTIMDSFKKIDVMKFRHGAKNFIINMYKRNIPIIIISAGIGNFIEKFLEYNECYFDNIFIVSNFLKFNNNNLVGFSNDIIHSLNKELVNLPNNIKDLIYLKNKIILLGDSVSDINMATGYNKDNILSIGFLENNIENNIVYYKKTFDIVATENSSLDEIVKKIKILRR